MAVTDKIPVNRRAVACSVRAHARAPAPFTTLSGEPIRPLYTERDLPDDREAAIGLPGQFPFTRGVYPSMYRGRLWTMRQFAGFGTAEETNARFHYLLEHGQTGLSTAFDMPSLMGHDSDHPRSLWRGRPRGRGGRHGARHGDSVPRHPARRGDRLDDDQRAGGDHARVLRGRRRAPGRACRAPRRHDPDRHPEGVHRSEGVVLPGRPGDAAGDRHGRVVLGRDAALASDLDLRLPHPRGRRRRRRRS